MNRKEMIELLQAEEEGKQVQEFFPSSKAWVNIDFTLTVLNNMHGWSDREYRIKPEPLKCWVNIYPDGTFSTFYSEQHAKDCAGHRAIRIAVPMIEVEE